jgi:hypothetical protein
MSSTQAISPTSAEIESAILQLQERFPRWVAVRNVRKSTQGRPVYGVTVSDPAAAEEDKQHALVLGGQHGNEESGRMTALALLQWLTSDQAKDVRLHQKVVVMPNVNPDGAEADTPETAQGVNLNADHAPSGPVSPEGQAVEEVAYELEPEAVVDLHARGYTGCSFDMVLYPWTRPYTEDGRLVAAIAEEMAAAGEAAGLPHLVHPLTWPGWWDNVEAEGSSRTLLFMYRNFKSLCLLTETAESNEVAPPPALRAAVGLARVRALLAWGQRRHPCLYYPGYPINLVTNLFCMGITAVGPTTARRRKSRVGIWRNAASFQKLGGERPEYPDHKVVHCTYDGKTLPDGAGIQYRIGGRRDVRAVHLNGRQLTSSETDGFVSWQDVCSTFVQVNLPVFQAGSYELRLELC